MRLGRSFTVLNSKDTKKFMEILNEQFGISGRLGFVFLQNNREKVYIMNRDIERIDSSSINIDAIGLYVGKFQRDGFRPSIEGSQIFGNFAKKNVVEVTQKQKHDWMKGMDIDYLGSEDAIVLLRCGNDFIGSGKLKEGIIINAVPSSRRLSVVNETLENEI